MYGRVVGDYELIEKINQGGMAVIYKARSKKTSEIFALRIMLPGLEKSSRNIRNFSNGARIALKCDHPNIVKVFDVNLKEENPHIVLEFVNGENLKARLLRNDSYVRQYPLSILIAVAEALQYIHSKKIIHRDIKPENILISQGGQAKIADFSLAIEKKREYILSKILCGSPSYIAPERILRKKYDERTDIYSLGITSYELLTRRLPYSGRTDQEILRKHVDRKYKPISIRELNPSVSEKLENIVMRSIEKDPEKRYPDIGLFLRDLKRIF